MEKKEKILYQGDFYKHYRKTYPDVIKELGSKWNPERWNPRYDYFSEVCYGWRTFLDVLPKDHKQIIKNMTFEFLTKPLDVESLMNRVQTIVNNYWNKIVICKTIDTDEERRFRTLMNGIKELSELSKKGILRVSKRNISENLTDIDANRFTCSEIPPESKFISNKVYITNNGCWWEIHGINLSNNNSNDDDYDDEINCFYFKSNEPKKVPEMKCTFQDGVFMAIPGELISNKKLTKRFTKLLTDDTENGKDKTKKKKKLTHSELGSMDYNELIQVIRDYDLNIPFDDNANDDDVDVEDIDALQNDIERALGINRR